ncbi:MAG: class I SAM-dependent methyltransferase [Azospirillaceae bacterium]
MSDQIAALPIGNATHAAGAFDIRVLKRIEELLPRDIERSAETGCGKSTILFSNLSKMHTVFTLDDRKQGLESSVKFFFDCPLTQIEKVNVVYGPTQQTLPNYRFSDKYQLVLIDGPHGFPFPEIEYYYFYPHIEEGGFLIIDDVHIPTIGRFADVVKEDSMFSVVELVETTLLLRRTGAPTFDPLGDGWWEQNYNRRRISDKFSHLAQYKLHDNNIASSFESNFGIKKNGFLGRLKKLMGK